VLQTVLVDLCGGLGLVWSSALFAALYLGSPSPVYALFVFVVGLYFGWCVRRTGSLWGVMIAHGALNVALLLIGPLLAR
jgi:membrane protease YdiL (CAAX protease family)